MYWFHIAKLLPFLSPCNPCGRVKAVRPYRIFSIRRMGRGLFPFCTEKPNLPMAKPELVVCAVAVCYQSGLFEVELSCFLVNEAGICPHAEDFGDEHGVASETFNAFDAAFDG